GRSVLVVAEEDAERGGRLGELLDLLLQELELLPLGLEDGDELLVLGHDPLEIAARLQHLLLQDLDLTRGVRQTPAEQRGLVLEELDLRLELVDVLLVALDLLPRIGLPPLLGHLVVSSLLPLRPATFAQY